MKLLLAISLRSPCVVMHPATERRARRVEAFTFVATLADKPATFST